MRCLLLVAFFIFSTSHSQNIPSFNYVWSNTLKTDPKIARHSYDGEIFFATDGKTATCFEGKTGKNVGKLRLIHL